MSSTPASAASTSSDYRDLLLFDRRFVEAAEAGVEDIAPVAKELTGDEYV